MTRVSITIDVMGPVRISAADKVDAYFNQLAHSNLHRDHAHEHKRRIAASVRAGGEPTAEFEAEATLRSLQWHELSALILAKPNAAAARELARQKIMLKIESATAPGEIDGILANMVG